jgi:hypothetical protein
MAVEMELVDSVTGVARRCPPVDHKKLGEGAEVGSDNFSRMARLRQAKAALDQCAHRVRTSLDAGHELAREHAAQVDRAYRPYGNYSAFVVAPLPVSSPAIGAGVIPVLAYIFPFSKNDKVSPPSTIGASGLITNNGSRGFGAGGQLFLKENTYEVTAGYVRGNVNWGLYGPGILSGKALKLPLKQTGNAFFGEALRRVAWKVFVGPRFWNGDSFLTQMPSSGQIPALPPNLGIHTTLRAMGIRLVRDTRPNHFYPTAGTKLEFTSDFFSQALGSKYSFQSYKLYFNKYWSLRKNQVIAYDLFVCDTAGQPPFYGNCMYGTKNELRGYTAGRYIDRHMATTQLEYRLTLPMGFGLAAFGGIGGVIPGATQLFRSNQFLPALGGGPRYELSSKYHVNFRTDFAKGKDSWTWSMGVGEAF